MGAQKKNNPQKNTYKTGTPQQKNCDAIFLLQLSHYTLLLLLDSLALPFWVFFRQKVVSGRSNSSGELGNPNSNGFFYHGSQAFLHGHFLCFGEKKGGS